MGIRIRQLSKAYPGGVQALDNLDLEVEGGTFGLLGPNGAGKTTLMRILATVLPPTRGEAWVCGLPVSNATAVRRLLGYLPQTFGFYPQLSALATLEYFAILGDERPQRGYLLELLERVGLAEAARRPVGTFSGGMRQRLLLIVDEPTAGLDPEARVDFRNLLGGLRDPEVILLSTHIVADVETTCRDIAVLVGGRLAFRGRPSDLAGLAADHVFRVTVPADQAAGLEGRGRVSGIVRDGDRAHVRIIVQSPEALAGLEPTAVNPSVEDGYLWLMHTARGRDR
ncbi:MAG: ABC transporter ATP-binding protein [Acetobacteraceae bacterium]|nr:ABC transporter ATP-binding protein [Acetobacteraceae bacterium]